MVGHCPRPHERAHRGQATKSGEGIVDLVDVVVGVLEGGDLFGMFVEIDADEEGDGKLFLGRSGLHGRGEERSKENEHKQKRSLSYRAVQGAVMKKKRAAVCRHGVDLRR